MRTTTAYFFLISIVTSFTSNSSAYWNPFSSAENQNSTQTEKPEPDSRQGSLRGILNSLALGIAEGVTIGAATTLTQEIYPKLESDEDDIDIHATLWTCIRHGAGFALTGGIIYEMHQEHIPHNKVVHVTASWVSRLLTAYAVSFIAEKARES